MKYTEQYLLERQEYIEKKVAEYEKDVYHGDMPASSKTTLRQQLREEYDYEMRQAIRQDSNTGRDDQ